MKLHIYKALWGMDGPLEANFERIAAANYQGVEAWPQSQIEDPAHFRALVDAYGFELIIGGSIFTFEEVESTLNELASFHPLKINLQGGLDAMPFDVACHFIEEVLRVAAQLDVPVLLETHRGRPLFTPWTTAAYLQRFPNLRITADYSHWVNVCERLPDDQAEYIALANSRADHIHGRVGYEEGPQVPHPAAPEYAHYLAWHEQHWQQIYAHHLARGAETLTFTPEYGPPGYLHTLPYTNAPVADLWALCLWGAEQARTLFGLDGNQS